MYPTKPLWEISKLIMGQSPKSETYNTNKIWLPFYQWKKEFWKISPTPEIWCSEPIKIVEKNDILISVRAPVWPTNLCQETTCIWRWLAWIRPDYSILELNFLRYFFKKYEEEISQLWKWSTFSSITKTDLENLQIPLPPIPTQQKIVEKIDKIFEKIDKNIEITKKNIANIEEENNSLLEGIFSECEKEFGVEKIEKTLDKDFSIWKIPVKEYLKEWILPIIDQWKNFIWWYTNDDSQKYNWKLPVLVYWDHTNSVKFIDFDFVWWADGIKIFKFCEGIDTKYMFYIINYYKPENLWYRRHFPILKQIQIPLPPLPNQQKIVETLDKIFAKNSELKNFYEKNLKNLEELKQSILKQAFEDENFIK